LNIICNRSFFLFWNDVSFVPVRVLHKDEKILGRKHIYLPHAQTAIYDSKVKCKLCKNNQTSDTCSGEPLVFRILWYNIQGFQSGPVPGTFTRLRSCIVPAEHKLKLIKIWRKKRKRIWHWSLVSLKWLKIEIYCNASDRNFSKEFKGIKLYTNKTLHNYFFIILMLVHFGSLWPLLLRNPQEKEKHCKENAYGI
jgi:hypothetical protein